MINNSNFIIDEVPHLHPASQKYVDFWREQKRRCIEGYWVQGKWMPGKLYFYINFATIKKNIKGSKVKSFGTPDLRDIEWKTFLLWDEARGFSGFEKDEEFSCNELIPQLYATQGDISNRIRKNNPNIFNLETGYLKKFIPAREYLEMIHPTNLGRPLYENQSKNLFIMASRGWGKLVLRDEPIRIKEGWKPMEEVKVGDKVYGLDGKLCNVIFKTDLQKDVNLFKMTLRDGREVTVCEDHKWYVWSKNKAKTKTQLPFEIKTTKELYNDYYWTRIDSKHKKKYGETKYIREYKYALPSTEALNSETRKENILHPYVIGCLLGDGSLTTKSIKITNIDQELLDRFEKHLPEGYYLNPLNEKDYSIKRNSKDLKAFWRLCDEEGIWNHNSGTKFIPEHLLYSSDEDRLELLKGLMDTDGYAVKNRIEYCTVSRQLCEDVKDICRSLGMNCRSGKYKSKYKGEDGKYIHCQDRYRINIYPNRPIFALERKNTYDIKTSREVKTFITNIEPAGKGDGYCIQVDNDTNTYLLHDYIPTHNSYSVGGIVAHEYTFDGRTKYEVGQTMTSSEVVVGAGDAKYSTETLAKTRIMLERFAGDYEQGDKYYPAPFTKRYLGSWEPAKQISYKYKEKINNNWVWSGTGSNIKHRTFKDNPFAANGTRPGVMIFEEVGFFDNIKETYGASVECQRDGSDKFGSMLFVGTGGDMSGGSTLGAQTIFYNPDAYDCLTFEDIWEFRGKIGYFLPAYLGLAAFKDDNGITDVKAAKKYLDDVRSKLKNTKGSSINLEKEIINRPILPSEMFLQATGNLFPIPELRHRLAQLETEEKWGSLEKNVELYFDPKCTEFNGVNYELDTAKKLKPINEFPWKDTNRQGAVTIYEFPQLIDGVVPKDTYIIGHDPYRSDSDSGDSLGTITVLKTKKHFSAIGHDEIVAEYAGRPFEGRHTVNEILYKLGLFYNATIYFENAVGNVKEYFEKVKALRMLARRPRTVLNKKAAFQQVISSEYGYPMSSRQMKLEGVAYIREWLLEERGQNSEGHSIRNLDRIWSKALLQELIAFNLDNNFDRVMSLMGAIIGLNETYNQFQNMLESSEVSKKQDEFNKLFTNNKYIFSNANQMRI